MKRAVLIGINYRGTSQELRGPEDDVLKMQRLLRNEGYRAENILLLTENNVTPSHFNILASWKWLYSGLPASSFSESRSVEYGRRDNIVACAYYSGHGVQMPDRNADEDDGKDECLVPLDYLTRGVLTDDMIRLHLVDKLPPNSTLFCLFDACNSGSGCDLPWNYYRYRAPSTYTVFHDKYPEKPQKICCIAAALDSELAYETGSAGILTSRFLASYKSGIVSKNLIKLMQENVNQQTLVLSTAREQDLDTPVPL